VELRPAGIPPGDLLPGDLQAMILQPLILHNRFAQRRAAIADHLHDCLHLVPSLSLLIGERRIV
jgi:hypothetical protein